MMDNDDYDDDNDSNTYSDDESSPPPSKNLSTTSSQIGSISERPQLTVESSMFRLLADVSPATPDDSSDTPEKKSYNLKPIIIQEINEEIIADLETVYKGIADQAVDYIHAKYVYGIKFYKKKKRMESNPTQLSPFWK